MKNIYLILKVACVVLLMGACTPEEFEQFDNSTVHQDWPLAMNRTGHVVDSVVWYETEENHAKCIYEYDQNNKLKKYTLYITILEQGQVKNKMSVDTQFYASVNRYLANISNRLDNSTITEALSRNK